MNSERRSLRIDRWLFYCRFYKTRVLATASVTGGHVKINGERAVPGTRVKTGDVVNLLRDRLPYELTVTEIPNRRGPAVEARACYHEAAAAQQQRESLQQGLRTDRLLMPRTAGRPDKHTRRRLRQRNRGDTD